jgi:hypothetical protein
MPASGNGFSTGLFGPINSTLGFEQTGLRAALRDFYFGQPGSGPVNVNLSLTVFVVSNRTPAIQVTGIYPITVNNIIVTNRPVNVIVGVSVVLTRHTVSVLNRGVSIDIPGTGSALGFTRSRKKRKV